MTGRSYGGYLTLAALAFSPGCSRAGVDICGMSDLHTFYARHRAVDRGGGVQQVRPSRARLRPAARPVADAPRVENIDVPLLVVHGELDTNVPIGEAHQIVAALRDLGRPVEYLRARGRGSRVPPGGFPPLTDRPDV